MSFEPFRKKFESFPKSGVFSILSMIIKICYFAGCTFIFLLILICLHTYNNKSVHSYSPNYYNHDHHSGEDGASIAGAASGGIFVNAGSKKLQQSSNYIPEEEGVKFLPVIR